MKKRELCTEQLNRFALWLREEERCEGTVEKYLRDAAAFSRWLDRREVTRERCTAWKEALLAEGYAPVTVNSMLSALNSLFRCLGWEECRVKYLRIQRRLFRASERQLSCTEYRRLIQAARGSGRERLGLLMETICATGIRVSELQYITVDAARQRRCEVALKGKIRTILIPERLSRKLLGYAKRNGLTSGEIFLTGNGKSLSRRQIWAEMKALCSAAGVEPSKVYPHNLRHLFAETYYKASRDIAQLADVLGHSSIETTRIYLVSTGEEHAKRLDSLGLVV